MSILQKLVEASELVKAPKSLRNDYGKYSYRNLEQMLESIKPALKSLGLAVYFTDEIIVIGDRYYVKATAFITDGKDKLSSSSFVREDLSRKGIADSAMISASCSSYARKYALCGLLAIDSGEKDPDERGEEDLKETLNAINCAETLQTLIDIYSNLSRSQRENIKVKKALAEKKASFKHKSESLKDRI